MSTKTASDYQYVLAALKVFPTVACNVMEGIKGVEVHRMKLHQTDKRQVELIPTGRDSVDGAFVQFGDSQRPTVFISERDACDSPDKAPAD